MNVLYSSSLTNTNKIGCWTKQDHSIHVKAPPEHLVGVEAYVLDLAFCRSPQVKKLKLGWVETA